MIKEIIEEYRCTLAALNDAYERKQRERASEKLLDTLRTEIEEVSEVLIHLTKGESRYRWKL